MIFISYAREDLEEVRGLYHRLKDSGYDPWMDEVDLLPGQKWRPAIEKAIKQCDFFLLCVSSRSINKQGFVQREIRIALDLAQERLEDDAYLIPALIEQMDHKKMPPRISEFQWVDLCNEGGWEQLVKTLQMNRQRPATPPTATKKMPTTTLLSEIKRKALHERLAMLARQYQDANRQLRSTLNAKDKAPLEEQLRGLAEEISEAEVRLNALD